MNRSDVVEYRHNPMDVNSLKSFFYVKGGLNQNRRDVYFVRLVGCFSGETDQLLEMEAALAGKEKEGGCAYQRLAQLPVLMSVEEADHYSKCYDAWQKNGCQSLELGCTKGNESHKAAAGAALKRITDLYRQSGSRTDSMIRNFAIKLLYWYDAIRKDASTNWTPRDIAKVVASNIVKEQEYLFYYFLTLTGVDVLLLQMSGDIGKELKKHGFSVERKVGEFSDAVLPPYSAEGAARPVAWEKEESMGRSACAAPAAGSHKPDRMPQIKEQEIKKSALPRERAVRPEVHPEHTFGTGPGERREKSYEELANMASSVVMISVYDQTGNVMGTGSGIMIGRKGYILTNNHVIAGGRGYSVRIEEDQKIYNTSEVIKYNPVLDLAVIRIGRELAPIPLYGGKELFRGQKVVAIGSPLGLFNSVSEGIISGFRIMDSVEMIQFTAPTSPGSSGGALLDMYGQIIGISTAGMDRGQNINLAVSYKLIGMFVKGFT